MVKKQMKDLNARTSRVGMGSFVSSYMNEGKESAEEEAFVGSGGYAERRWTNCYLKAPLKVYP